MWLIDWYLTPYSNAGFIMEVGTPVSYSDGKQFFLNDVELQLIYTVLTAIF